MRGLRLSDVGPGRLRGPQEVPRDEEMPGMRLLIGQPSGTNYAVLLLKSTISNQNPYLLHVTL